MFAGMIVGKCVQPKLVGINRPHIPVVRDSTGISLNYRSPQLRSKHGWLLAGGINPGNASEALCTLRPNGIDVSSGICSPDGISKDPLQISSFMRAVNSTKF